MSSSRKIKDNIFALCGHEALEALVHLTPVKFNYKTQDAENVRIGFIAEDVPELVVRFSHDVALSSRSTSSVSRNRAVIR